MNGKVSKKLRREAEKATPGQPTAVTRRVYRQLKYDYKMSRKYPNNFN